MRVCACSRRAIRLLRSLKLPRAQKDIRADPHGQHAQPLPLAAPGRQQHLLADALGFLHAGLDPALLATALRQLPEQHLSIAHPSL